jgi:hypothetical protein
MRLQVGPRLALFRTTSDLVPIAEAVLDQTLDWLAIAIAMG